VGVYQKHLEKEFEVQIRDGSITLEGREILNKLRGDFAVLQFEDKIEEIIQEAIKRLGYYDLNLVIEPVRRDLLDLFSSTIHKLKQVVKDTRRKIDNDLCVEKCRSGPVIYNFTKSDLPAELTDFLKDGLNNVPSIDIEKEVFLAEVENDVKLACCNFFIATAGYYPRSFTLKDSIDTTIKNLLILEPGNNEISSALRGWSFCS
jgi:hypothetical protein